MSLQPRRYHPALVALHWLLALVIIVALVMGTFVLEDLPNSAPDKIGALRGHMIIGIGIGGLMLVRLLVRVFSKRPAPASTGNKALDMLGGVVHAGLYLAVFAMVASGMATALQAGLPQIVFQGSGAALPANVWDFPPRRVHGVLAKLIMVLVVLHLLGALFHQFARRDKLLSRMWFGSR